MILAKANRKLEGEAENEENIDEVPEDTAEIEAGTQEQEELAQSTGPEPLDQADLSEYADYAELIRSGSRIVNREGKGYKRKDGRFQLQIKGKGGSATVYNESSSSSLGRVPKITE